MSLLTGGQAVARMFRDYVIKYMFGVPGGQTFPSTSEMLCKRHATRVFLRWLRC